MVNGHKNKEKEKIVLNKIIISNPYFVGKGNFEKKTLTSMRAPISECESSSSQHHDSVLVVYLFIFKLERKAYIFPLFESKRKYRL